MPGTRHELAAAAPARVTTVQGWRDLRALEPALDALQLLGPVIGGRPMLRYQQSGEQGEEHDRASHLEEPHFAFF